MGHAQLYDRLMSSGLIDRIASSMTLMMTVCPHEFLSRARALPLPCIQAGLGRDARHQTELQHGHSHVSRHEHHHDSYQHSSRSQSFIRAATLASPWSCQTELKQASITSLEHMQCALASPWSCQTELKQASITSLEHMQCALAHPWFCPG